MTYCISLLLNKKRNKLG